MENKSYKGLVWLVVVLIIIVVALMGFMVYKDFFSDKTNNVNNTTTTTKTEIADDANDLKTYDGLYIDNGIKDNDIKNVYTLVSNIGFMATGYEWDFGEKNKLTVDDLNKDKKREMAFIQLTKDKKVKFSKTTEEGGKLYTFSKQDFKDAWQTVYGNNNVEFVEQFSHNNCSINLEKEQAYLVDCSPAGREDDDEVYILMDTSKSDNKIEFTVAYYYVEKTQNSNGEFISNVYYNVNNNQQIICDENQVNQYLDKLIQYKFTFTKKTDNYVFESIEKIN